MAKREVEAIYHGDWSQQTLDLLGALDVGAVRTVHGITPKIRGRATP